MMEDIIKLTQAIRDNDDINYGTIISLQLIDDKAKQQDSLLKEAIKYLKILYDYFKYENHYDKNTDFGKEYNKQIDSINQFFSKVEAMK